jgi:hypothetical protein
LSKVFEEYWKLRMVSATARLRAAQQIISHNPTRGSAAESALRTLLREFLPLRCGTGSGFLLDPQGNQSRQLDLIVFDQLDSAPLYRDGDLVIVSPGSAYLMLEVKSVLNREDLEEAFENIASAKRLAPQARGIIFGYESAKPKTLADALSKTAKSGYEPDQILCLQERILVSWSPTVKNFTGYQLEDGHAVQQLISEVLTASKVANLHPYLPSLQAGNELFKS